MVLLEDLGHKKNVIEGGYHEYLIYSNPQAIYRQSSSL